MDVCLKMYMKKVYLTISSKVENNKRRSVIGKRFFGTMERISSIFDECSAER